MMLNSSQLRLSGENLRTLRRVLSLDDSETSEHSQQLQQQQHHHQQQQRGKREWRKRGKGKGKKNHHTPAGSRAQPLPSES
jgi:hypothetical protein